MKRIQVGYNATQKMTPVLNLAGEAIVETIQQGMIDSLVTSIIDGVTKSGRFMDALRRGVARGQLLIAPMTGHVGWHIIQTEELTCWRRGPCNSLDTTHQSLLKLRMVKAWRVIPHKCLPFEIISDEGRRHGRNYLPKRHNKWNHSTLSTTPGPMYRIIKILSLGRRQFPENQESAHWSLKVQVNTSRETR